MYNKNEKILLAILGIIAIGDLVAASYCYARAQYYQGRIDASKEHLKMLEQLKDDFGMVSKEVEAE